MVAPGLRGFLMGQQQNMAEDAANMQKVNGVLGLQGALMQQGMLAQQLQDKQIAQQRLNAYVQSLPPEQQAAAMLNPSLFIENQYKTRELRPGGSLVQGNQVVMTAPESYTLAPGQTRMRGDQQVASMPADYTNKPFIANPNGGAPIPNQAYQNYEMGKANAGATRVQTNVNSFTPASEEAQRKFMDSTRTTYDALKSAPTALQNIEAAKRLIPEAKGFMGPGGESLLEAAKFLNNRLGTNINTEGISSAEELRTRVFMNIMDNLKKMDASPSQMQQQIMMDSLGKLGTDPNAMARVLDAFGETIRGKVDAHNKEVAGATERGVKFPYDPTINIPQPAAPQSTPPAQASAAPAKGAVVKGYVFLGGDPANKMNWRKAP